MGAKRHPRVRACAGCPSFAAEAVGAPWKLQGLLQGTAPFWVFWPQCNERLAGRHGEEGLSAIQAAMQEREHAAEVLAPEQASAAGLDGAAPAIDGPSTNGEAPVS